MYNKREFRYSSELRAESSGSSMALVGYAITWGTESSDPNIGFVEICLPGCVSKCLREGTDVRCLFNHEPSRGVLGRVKNGTLVLTEDAHGLQFRCTLNPQNPFHQEIFTSVSRGDVSDMSFGFIATGQQWSDEKGPDGEYYNLRKLSEITLTDVSCVVYPAYKNTSVSARNAQDTAKLYFPEGEIAEIRSALDELAVKRAEASKMAQEQRDAAEKAEKEKRDAADATKVRQGGEGDDKPAETGDVVLGQLSADVQKAWTDAFDKSFNDSVAAKAGRKKAITDAYAAANTAVEAITAKLPDDESDASQASATPPPVSAPIDTVPTAVSDINSRKAELADMEKRGVHKSAPVQQSGTCPVCRCAECRCDCDDPTCWCQNQDVDPMDVWGDDDDFEDDTDERKAANAKSREARKAALTEETRSKKVKTKTVAGKHLPSSAFAYVGSEDDTSTWKLPVQDKAHAQNALARENQTEGIPAGKKAAVHSKIVAAAKKFGIHVDGDTRSEADRKFDAEMLTKAQLNEYEFGGHNRIV